VGGLKNIPVECVFEKTFWLGGPNAGAGLGPRHLYFERVSHHDSRRDGALWHDEDGAACHLSRHGRADQGDEGHGEYRSSRSNAVGGHCRFLQTLASTPNPTPEQAEKEFFEKYRGGSLLQRLIEDREVADLVAYVASPLSLATNGAALRVEGGLLRSIA
jgi:hypothetical protein